MRSRKPKAPLAFAIACAAALALACTTAQSQDEQSQTQERQSQEKPTQEKQPQEKQAQEKPTQEELQEKQTQEKAAQEPPKAQPADPDAVAHAVHELQERRLDMPVKGARADQLVSSFRNPRTGHIHEALDIPAPRGTPVLAVEDGTIEKLFLSKPGGNTIYQFDPSRRFAYYYAHLDRYAEGLKERQKVRRGDVIAYVGSTGNASPTNPHLHFGIFLLTPERQWWKGTALDPYPLLRWDSGSR